MDRAPSHAVLANARLPLSRRRPRSDLGVLRARPSRCAPAAQLSLSFRVSLRELVLSTLRLRNELITGASLAQLLRIEYKQCIDVLHALHRDGLIFRAGRKSTARWGSLALAPITTFDPKLFQETMHAFAARK